MTTGLCWTSLGRAASPDQIQTAIHKGVAFLYSQQNGNGNWEKSQTRQPIKGNGSGIDDGQWGGRSALATYALLTAGERPLDDRIVKATHWLRQAPLDGIYAIGMRANVWESLPASPANLNALRADGKKLASSLGPPNTKYSGTYDYFAGQKFNRLDVSVSQYGVLGMWAVAQRLEGTVLPQYWMLVEQAWHRLQQPDGGWTYYGEPGGGFSTSIQMTAAGVASLFITQDYVHSGDGLEGNRGNISDKALNSGLEFIGKKLPDLIQNPNFYAMYGIERIGVASGYKYIGNLDWFKAGADVLVHRQSGEGNWGGGGENGPVPDCAFSVLFLSRGRAPVMMNKLQYKLAAKGGSAEEGHWNQRPRDVANATAWISGKLERRLNWQIIDLNHQPLDDLHDSQILYISGNEPLSFTDQEIGYLKQYVEEGGLILGTADAENEGFSKSFRQLGKTLFPEYEFKSLDEKSPGPLMTGEQFPASQWKRKMRIESLGNGARHMMVLIPDGDLGRTFQRRDTNRPEAYQFVANLFLYCNDKTAARFKGDTHVVREDPAITTQQTITVARLKYNGRWDPEPAGWRRLAAVIQRQDKTKVVTKTVELGKDSLDGVTIAHLTGTDKFTLTAAQRTALQTFVKNGGLLVIDACGGVDAFNASAQAELSQMFPDDVAQIATPLKGDSPLFAAAGGAELHPVYRTYTLLQRPAGANGFRLTGIRFNGKLGVIYSSDDLSEGLVGQSVDGIIGYDPAVATELVRRILKLKTAGTI